jgi:hypothetical protein
MMLLARVLPDRVLDGVLQRTFALRPRTISSVACNPSSGLPPPPVSTAGPRARDGEHPNITPAATTAPGTYRT